MVHTNNHHHEDHGHDHVESPSVFEVALKSKREVAEGTMAFFFEKPENFSFRAGQHIEMKLIKPPETDAEGNSRMFSLVNSPSENYIIIATRMRDTAFKRVLGKIPIGGKVTIENPHGSFLLQNDTSKPAVFLIGGIGITPVFSMIKEATEKKLPHRLVLFYSNKRPEDAPFLPQLQSLAQQNPNFKLIATMTEVEKSTPIKSGSKAEWNGEIGYIDQVMLRKYLNNLQIPIYYISGPPGMVAAMRKLLTDSGVNEDNIRTEEFSGY